MPTTRTPMDEAPVDEPAPMDEDITAEDDLPEDDLDDDAVSDDEEDDEGAIGLLPLYMDDLAAVDEEYDPELDDPELDPPFDVTQMTDEQIEELVAMFGQEVVLDWYEKLINTPNINYPASEYDASGEPLDTEE
jgi:hypothetical protein